MMDQRVCSNGFEEAPDRIRVAVGQDDTRCLNKPTEVSLYDQEST